MTEISTMIKPTNYGYGNAHGKAILIGEHSVVYGAPAIAVPLYDLGVEATLDNAEASFIDSDLYVGPIDEAPESLNPPLCALRNTADVYGLNLADLRLRVRSTIPHERGLGSSAAVSTAIVRAVADYAGDNPSKKDVYDLTQQAEKIAHGTPSGLDAYTVSATSAVRFQNGKAQSLLVSRPFQLVVADTGIRGRTSIALQFVRERMETRKAKTTATIGKLGELTDTVQSALATGDTEALGNAMNKAHELLVSLGVSGHELDGLVKIARDSGASGAKMTGGGLGGCVLALAPDSYTAHKIASDMRKAGAKRAWISSLASVTTQPLEFTQPLSVVQTD